MAYTVLKIFWTLFPLPDQHLEGWVPLPSTETFVQ